MQGPSLQPVIFHLYHPVIVRDLSHSRQLSCTPATWCLNKFAVATCIQVYVFSHLRFAIGHRCFVSYVAFAIREQEAHAELRRKALNE